MLGGERSQLLTRVLSQLIDPLHAAIAWRQRFPALLEHPDQALLGPLFGGYFRKEVAEDTVHQRTRRVPWSQAGGNPVDVLIPVAEPAGFKDPEAEGRV